MVARFNGDLIIFVDESGMVGFDSQSLQNDIWLWISCVSSYIGNSFSQRVNHFTIQKRIFIQVF